MPRTSRRNADRPQFDPYSGQENDLKTYTETFNPQRPNNRGNNLR
jgi:hypothetical protein